MPPFLLGGNYYLKTITFAPHNPLNVQYIEWLNAHHCGVLRHMKLRDQVGINIQKLRRERGISQEALALMAKVNRGYMGRLENAKYSASLDIIEKISGALNVEPSVLLNRDDFIQVIQRFDPKGQAFLPMEHIQKGSRSRKLKAKRLQARPIQEGVIFTEDRTVMVWKDYEWDTEEITRFWTRGFEGVPEEVITIRQSKRRNSIDR